MDLTPFMNISDNCIFGPSELIKCNLLMVRFRSLLKYIIFYELIFIYLVQDVKKRWKSLRDQYRAYKRSGSEGDSVNDQAKHWQHMDRMSFMARFMVPRRYGALCIDNWKKYNLLLHW
jgi:hypothetical protein